MDVQKLAADIRLLILDVDGVLTDGQVFISGSGEEFKNFNIKDGHGLKSLQDAGISVAVITGRSSASVTYRMQELGIKHVYQGQKDKRAAFNDLLAQLKLTAREVAYIGDDLPDLPIMKLCGLGIAVCDAVDELKDHADWVTNLDGGRGAVREACDMLLKAQQKFDLDKFLLA